MNGCVILLVDESQSMDAPIQDDSESRGDQPRKSKAASVATAVNALLKQLSAGPDFEIALVGYGMVDGQPRASCRWQGALAGREFVRVSELAANPLAVEERKRRISDPASLTGYREEAVPFTVWYVPSLSGIAPQVFAFQYCKELLAKWLETTGASAGMPLVLHITGGASGDGNPVRAIEEIRGLAVAGGSPVVYQAHLCVSKNVPCNAYASNRLYVPSGAMRDLFDRCSPLTPAIVQALRAAKVPAGPNSRGFAYNARMSDVSKFLSMTKAHVASWSAPAAQEAGTTRTATPLPPPPGRSPAAPTAGGPVAAAPAPPALAASATAAETPAAEPVGAAPPSIQEPAASVAPAPASTETVVASPAATIVTAARGTEKAALVVFLIDRSAEDPFSADPQNACGRLVKQTNELLAQLGRKAEGRIETAIVSYGTDLMGESDVRRVFEGPLAGRCVVTDADLATGALRVDEVEEQRSDGVGGVMTVCVKKPTYVELDPTNAASPFAAFAAVAGIVGEWCGNHAQACAPPVVVHLTRGKHDPALLQDAAGQLASHATAGGGVLLYHVIATEAPHPSVLYPASADEFQDSDFKTLWELSGRLFGGEALAESKPGQIQAESRGLVVNGKFDLLYDGIKAALA